MRLAVYSANAYQRDAGRLYTDRAFVLFLAELARSLERLRLLGRVRADRRLARYRLSPEIEFVGLPDYESLAAPVTASAAVVRSLRRGWSALGGVDAILVFGPHPLGLLLAGLAAIRRRRVVLGVRQDLIAYVRNRHPRRPLLLAAALMLEGSWRLLSRLLPTVVVGPELARHYRHADRLHELTVSLVRRDDVVGEDELPEAGPSGHVELLTVGRLEQEKNPLMLADLLAELCRDDAVHWTIAVCGEGPLAGPLEQRLRDLGLAERATLHGYVPFDDMDGRYRAADVLVSPSWTEGFPQVIVEAFAAGLPVVATDVGGVGDGAPGAVMLVPPGDVAAAAAAVRRVVADRALRRALVSAGATWARAHTMEAEVERLVAFLEESALGRGA